MTSLRSLDPEVFLRAALWLEREWAKHAGWTGFCYPFAGCCLAITTAAPLAGGRTSEATKFFYGHFYPRPTDRTMDELLSPAARAGYWWNADELEPRLIALCLAAAILEDEQAKKPKRRRRRVSTI